MKLRGLSETVIPVQERSSIAVSCVPRPFQLHYRYNGAKPKTHQTIVDMAMNGSGCRDTARVLRISLNTVLRHLKKLTPHQVAQNVEPGAEVVICCEADEQWSYVRCKGNPRWLFLCL